VNYFIRIICFLTILSASFSVSAQNNAKAVDEIVWERYTTAWVEKDAENIEQKEIKTDKVLAKLPFKGVQLYIPQNPNITMLNGNKYIKAFLINNTKDSLVLNRIDATIGIKTEIKIDGEWKLFQVNSGSSCGNSYFTKKLPPKNYLFLNVENRGEGSIQVPYRLIVYIDKKPVVSNETMVYVTPKLVKLAGKPIKSISL
jgi:hypothetical protein